MIIFGSSSKLIGAKQVSLVCKACGQSVTNVFTGFKYFHIYWIPIFPFKKFHGTECVHCKQMLRDEELDEVNLMQIKQIQASFPIPFWGYIGVFVISALIIGGQISKLF